MLKSKIKVDELALVLIVALIAMFVVVHNRLSESEEVEVEKIAKMVLGSGASFASGGVIDEDKLKETQRMNYNDFKKSLNAKTDFCIYIEDGDGNVIFSKGSDKLSRDGVYCRE